MIASETGGRTVAGEKGSKAAEEQWGDGTPRERLEIGRTPRRSTATLGQRNEADLSGLIRPIVRIADDTLGAGIAGGKGVYRS